MFTKQKYKNKVVPISERIKEELKEELKMQRLRLINEELKKKLRKLYSEEEIPASA